MTKLTSSQILSLRSCLYFEGLGGSCALEYPEYRVREALRIRRLLKLNGRWNADWRKTFYDITDAGLAALKSVGAQP